MLDNMTADISTTLQRESNKRVMHFVIHSSSFVSGFCGVSHSVSEADLLAHLLLANNDLNTAAAQRQAQRNNTTERMAVDGFIYSLFIYLFIYLFGVLHV